MKDRTNRILLLVFLLSAAACAALCFGEIYLLLFLSVVPFFCLQLLLLRVSKKRVLRLIPVFPIVLLLIAAGYYWFFGKGWDALAALVFGLMSIAPTVGCVFALLVYRFWGRFVDRKWLIVSLAALGCTLAWMGQEISLGYWDRAFIKVLGFGCCIGLYLLLTRDRELLAMFRKPGRESLKLSLPLAGAVFLFLTVGYMLLSPWLDLSAIPEQLRYSDITAENFPVVSAYIILCNALLEEVFFRGFAFLALRRYASERFACLFSSLTFAAYHVSIMSNWFHPVWFAVFIAGLAAAGAMFNFLDRRGSIWNGYLVHAGANLAINLIGFRMFGIL